jgi:hypothetical protein
MCEPQNCKQEAKNEVDAYVIEYLQTPCRFDFYLKEVNKTQFISKEEWHPHTVYFQFVPLDYNLDKWRRIIKTTTTNHDFAYNLGKRPEKEKSWKFVGGEKRYVVGKPLNREEASNYNNEFFNNCLSLYFDFNKFCLTTRGGTNYIIPLHETDECIIRHIS